MNKRTKLAVLIGVIAAVVSAAVLVIVFWDKILEKFPCCKATATLEVDTDEEPEEDEIVTYTEEETEAFADLDTTEE